jgi:hypothetical protein
VTLTELLVLMSAFTMILSMSAMLLHRAMRTQMDSREFADAERSASRLGRQFRQDVHQSTAAVLESSKLGNDAFVQFQLPNNDSIEYSRVKGNVLRAVSRGGKVAAREEFAIQPVCKLAVREEKSPDRIILTIASPALDPAASPEIKLQSYRAAPLALQVEATLNRGAAASTSSAKPEQAP